MDDGNKRKEEAKKRKRIGAMGEELATRFLVKRGFREIERNYLKKWGEIDVIVEEKGHFGTLGKVHFVEVKTVSRNLSSGGHSLDPRGEYRPEDNVHPWKLKRLHRAIQSWLAEHDSHETRDWQLDLVTVLLDTENKKAKIEILENIF